MRLSNMYKSQVLRAQPKHSQGRPSVSRTAINFYCRRSWAANKSKKPFRNALRDKNIYKIYTKVDFLYSISICWCCCCLFYPFSWPAHAASTWSCSSSSSTSLSSLKRCTLKAKAMSLLSEWVVYRFACLLVFFPQRRAVCTVACGMWRVPCVCPSLSQSASVCAFPCCHCIVAWNKLMFLVLSLSLSLSLTIVLGFFCDFCRNATETLLVCLCACACAFKSQSQNHNSVQ